ncbi:transient receptor potential cation channel subfamily M member 2-like [Poecilia formosa]|uniref:transient receptor potential cation channel subfamily M member 2-like n=1 Tax=Poecilia formosa TaxID=48698 RepID=UPI0007B7927A|nr:PREDICTED: transient receptor potential cation channel subfamily M member 2-like [Poecilia formosa]
MACLDNNHTHFLLVDDGTYGCYGAEIPLRAELEKNISLENKENIKISVVCVVLNGGLSTLNTIYNAVNKGTPCVILQGSGRLADVIAHVSGQQNSTVQIDKLIENQLEKCFGQEYKSPTFKSQEKEYTEKIQEILKKRELLTIFRARKDGQGNLDVAVLDALFKASKTGGPQDKSWNKLLELAIGWNRADSAETHIFTEESVWTNG